MLDVDTGLMGDGPIPRISLSRVGRRVPSRRERIADLAHPNCLVENLGRTQSDWEEGHKVAQGDRRCVENASCFFSMCVVVLGTS